MQSHLLVWINNSLGKGYSMANIRFKFNLIFILRLQTRLHDVRRTEICWQLNQLPPPLEHLRFKVGRTFLQQLMSPLYETTRLEIIRNRSASNNNGHTRHSNNKEVCLDRRLVPRYEVRCKNNRRYKKGDGSHSSGLWTFSSVEVRLAQWGRLPKRTF